LLSGSEEWLRRTVGAFRLNFADEELERAFRGDYAQRIIGQARLSLLLGCVLYLGLGVQDPWFFPNDYGWIWLLRGIVGLTMLAGFLTSFRTWFTARYTVILLPISLLAGAGPMVMIAVGSRDVALSYYLGLALVITWAYTFSGMRFAPAMAVNVLLLSAYLPVAALPGVIPAVWVATNFSNLLATSLLVGFAAFVLEGQRRTLFYQATLLDEDLRSHRHRALTDALTGLPNREDFERRLQGALQRAERAEKPLAVMFIDIDDFKPVNDSYGHTVGDAALRILARRAADTLRANDTVARYGGDEFVVLLEDIATAGKADKVADKLRQAMREPFVVPRQGHGSVLVRVAASVGIAVYPLDGRTASALLHRADEAMYRDKRVGRCADRASGQQ
jgi:diguanylate cyclase (GGDEF)-like protein